MRLLLYIFIFFCVVKAQAQDDDVAKYFDDGGYATSMNVVKFNLTGLLLKEYNLSYERCLGDRFGILVEIGLTNGYSLFYPYETTFEEEVLSDPKLTYRIEPRIYVLGADAPEGFYSSIAYRKRQYALQEYSGRINTRFDAKEILFIAGFQLPFKNRVMFDFNYGLVFSKTELLNSVDAIEIENDIYSNVACRIGYKF